MSTYETVNYSKSQIKKAGARISKFEEGSPEFDKSIAVLDNWRAAHAYPLTVIANNVNDSLIGKDNYLIVQRLKRKESIIGKLRRPNNTGLDRMQDLAGCRVIVPTIGDVSETVSIIKTQLIKNGHEIVREDDYLGNPPTNSGYRSYHIIVRFRSDNCYNNMFVEIQVRTKLQNAWATAVEIIDCVENETLKAGTGSESYRYFFKLVSGLFSLHEDTQIVDGIPRNKENIVDEIYRLDREKNIREKLSAYSNAIKLAAPYPDDSAYYLLITDMRIKTLHMRSFRSDELSEATQTYQMIEKTMTNGMDVVLVAGRSINIIRDSYSNYFLNAQFFLSKISELCLEYPEKASIILHTSERGIRLSSYFEATHYTSNISKSLNIPEDGIGVCCGDTIYCPGWAMTLPDSYLRYSGIIRNFDEYIKDGRIKPHTVGGPAIIALRSGACFFVDKPTWQFVSDENSIVIKPIKEFDKPLLFLLGWLKSNICTWDLLWNRQSNCVYQKHVFLESYIPDLDHPSVLSVCGMVEEILNKERQFVIDFRTPNQEGKCKDSQEDVDAFNEEILAILRKIEDIFAGFYNLSVDDRTIINNELKLKGYYSFY